MTTFKKIKSPDRGDLVLFNEIIDEDKTIEPIKKKIKINDKENNDSIKKFSVEVFSNLNFLMLKISFECHEIIKELLEWNLINVNVNSAANINNNYYQILNAISIGPNLPRGKNYFIFKTDLTETLKEDMVNGVLLLTCLHNNKELFRFICNPNIISKTPLLKENTSSKIANSVSKLIINNLNKRILTSPLSSNDNLEQHHKFLSSNDHINIQIYKKRELFKTGYEFTSDKWFLQFKENDKEYIYSIICRNKIIKKRDQPGNPQHLSDHDHLYTLRNLCNYCNVQIKSSKFLNHFEQNDLKHGNYYSNLTKIRIKNRVGRWCVIPEVKIDSLLLDKPIENQLSYNSNEYISNQIYEKREIFKTGTSFTSDKWFLPLRENEKEYIYSIVSRNKSIKRKDRPGNTHYSNNHDYQYVLSNLCNFCNIQIKSSMFLSHAKTYDLKHGTNSDLTKKRIKNRVARWCVIIE